MKTSDFMFELPERLVAQYPVAERGESRLLVMDRKKRSLEHRMVRDLPSILPRGTLMVCNNSRVRKARLKATLVSGSGGNRSAGTGAKEGAEFLLLDRLDARTWRVMVNRAKRRRPEQRYCFSGGLEGEIVEAPPGTAPDNGLRWLRFDYPVDDAWLDIHGHIPLPPYIRRDDGEADSERYQTVYADRAAGAELGSGASAAAPTAGLHFTEELLGRLNTAGIETAFITLHVGLGTFLPVRAENIEDHKMHEETYTIDDETACRVEKAKAEGRKILAAGTTSLRALESAWAEDAPGAGTSRGEQGVLSGRLRRGEGTTSIFIYPGYTVKSADILFTNFHTPGSTLLMLVSAFADRDFVLEAYREAIKEEYRFFSYGDACLIL